MSNSTVSQSTKRARIPNPVSSTRELFSIVREVSFDALHDAAERVPRIAVIGPTLEDARASAELIFGVEARSYVVAQDQHTEWPSLADIIVVDRRVRNQTAPANAFVVMFSPSDPVERVRQELIQGGDDIELSLGRTFPSMRECAATHVIRTTSRVNAQFALASNLPALVPVVGGVLSAGADTIVLTKNQLMMIYKLAAIHGQNIDNRWRIYQEMIPVVGAGLAWRSAARSLAAMMPFAAGAVPKVAIAFAGTFVAGMAAHIYYNEGTRANAERIRDLYQQALHELRDRPGMLQSIPGAGRRRRAADASPHVVDVTYRTGTSSETP